MLKILFLNSTNGYIYTCDPITITTDQALFEQVDRWGDGINKYEQFPLSEIKEALDEIALLGEACQDS